MRAEDLLESVRAELAPVEEAIRSHRFLDSLAAGAVTRERLRAIAGEQQRIVASDRRSFAQLAARFPSPPAGDWFLSMAVGEGEALALLDGYAAWLAIDVAWLALNGSVGAVTLAFLANLAAWGENCATVAAALRNAHNAGDDAVAFFEFFAAPPPGFRENTLAVVQAGLDAGDDPREMRDAARLLQGYELRFWDPLADEL